MTNGKQKGKTGELELAKVLSAMFGLQCRRGQQYSGLEGEDVVGLAGVHIECKRVERLNVYAALQQSIRDANGSDIPIVCHRANRQPWMITFLLSDLISLVEIVNDHGTNSRQTE